MASPLDPQVLVNAVLGATREVCATMLEMEVTPRPPRFHSPAPVSDGGLVALLGLAGDWVGTGGLALSEPLACRLASRMLMAEFHAVNEEVLDAVAEITNMIVGNVKTTLEETLGPLGLSIPTVIFGREFSTRTTTSDWIVVPFACPDGCLEVYVCLEPNRAPHGPAPMPALEPGMASH
jgi:chemotaxis protein CheX